jgi:hypothetical protein
MHQGTNEGIGAAIAIDAVKLYDWLPRAQPNARLIYHHGFHLGGVDQELAEMLRFEAERGMLYLVQDKRAADARGHDYVAIRSSRKWAAGSARAKSAGSLSSQARAAGEALFRSSGK